jgi:glycosyltransferase involved in cell wall biosynthesis
VRIAFVNRFPFHETLAERLCGAAVAAGHETRYLGRAPTTVGAFQPIRTERPPWRGPVPPVRAWVLDGRDRRTWHLDDADLVVDLHAATALWVLGDVARVRIVHRTDLFVADDTAGALRRARARQLARAGARFVVHTERAQDDLRRVVPPASVTRLPLLGPDPEPRGARAASQPPVLLFVGDTRPEKGFEVLLDAVRDLDVVVHHVGGRVGAASSGERRVGHARVITSGRLSDSDLVRAYHDCDLVVCPYDAAYASSGSGSLVVAEALAYAAPVLATDSLRGAVPHDYGGVTFAPSTARGLRDALESLDLVELAAAAAREAPALADAATASRYFEGLLRLCASA